MKNISKAKILALRVPKHDRSEQERIVEHLNGMSARIRTIRGLQDAAAAEMNAFVPRILETAFGGGL